MEQLGIGGHLWPHDSLRIMSAGYLGDSRGLGGRCQRTVLRL